MERRLLTGTLFITVFATSQLFAGAVELMGQKAQRVVIVLPYDGDVYFARPADHFQAGTAQNMVLNQNGALALPNGVTQGSYTSPVLPTDQFNAMMMSYNGNCPAGAIIALFIRVLVGGMASEWVRFDPEQERVLYDLANGFQYRVDMQQPAGAATSPTVSSVNLLGSNLNYGYQTGQMFQNQGQQMTVPSGPVARPNIISRSSWGARAASSQSALQRPTTLVIHHTAGTKGGVEQVRGIQRYHQQDNGWSDIGYHFLVSPAGEIFEGRPENVQGAHVAGANSYSMGISAIGHYSNYDIDAPCWNSMVRTCAYLCAKYGISPSRIIGHQDLAQKDCPGRYIYSKMNQLRQAVTQMLQQSGVATD